MKTIAWISEVKTVQNVWNDNMRYYILICGVWRRVSKQGYFSRVNDATRSDCYKTIVKGNLVHNMKTVHGFYESQN